MIKNALSFVLLFSCVNICAMEMDTALQPSSSSSSSSHLSDSPKAGSLLENDKELHYWIGRLEKSPQGLSFLNCGGISEIENLFSDKNILNYEDLLNINGFFKYMQTKKEQGGKVKGYPPQIKDIIFKRMKNMNSPLVQAVVNGRVGEVKKLLLNEGYPLIDFNVAWAIVDETKNSKEIIPLLRDKKKEYFFRRLQLEGTICEHCRGKNSRYVCKNCKEKK